MCRTPLPTFLEVPPDCFVVFGSQNEGSLCQVFLADILETGTRNRCVIEATMFSEESVGIKTKFRAFPKRVGRRILSLERVDYIGTSEHY